MNASWDLARTDDAILAGGLLGGIAIGEGIVLSVEGLDAHPKQADNQSVLDGSTKKEIGHNRPIVHDQMHQLGEAGTLAGLGALGYIAALAFTKRRAAKS